MLNSIRFQQVLKKTIFFIQSFFIDSFYYVYNEIFLIFGQKYSGNATLVSFYTNDWKYAAYAKKLRRRCQRLHMPHIIEELPSTGSYLKNTCMKPGFIRDKLRDLKSPVLWMDCDGSLLRPPVFFNGLSCDFAARKMHKSIGRTWHVGTMWFNYNERTLDFLDTWIENTGAISDESALERTWREKQINAVNIPDEYFVLLRGSQPAKGVICHRISEGESKRIELPIAIERAKKGIL